ncbi:hypothetical protein F5Y17DRAFT_463458 [Xylariaceae sp. FL0594]|nr:hypothetical protein F5Y17DRAFT_463458 [Xylariaceae sp. FL0594]
MLLDVYSEAAYRPPNDEAERWIELLRTLANNIADRDFRLNRNSGRLTPTTPTTPAPATSGLSGSTDAGDPMQLDRVATTGPRGPLTAEEKERRTRLGLCRYCGGSGHIAASCSLLQTREAKAAKTAKTTTPQEKKKPPAGLDAAGGASQRAMAWYLS